MPPFHQQPAPAPHPHPPTAPRPGTVLSSTDSVAALQALDQDSQPLLFSLVFGEGVVNDATAVVLLRAVQKIRRV